MCLKKCLRPSKMMDLLGLIFNHVGSDHFHWDEIKPEIPGTPQTSPHIVNRFRDAHQ